jgi:hypothetical protein
LNGDRLWRSTEVTLGSQQADRIVVLPNMEGIVAHFDCVRAQIAWGKRFDGQSPVQVTVWTSEGKAELYPSDENAVRVEVPEGFWSTAADRDPCSSESRAQPNAPPQGSQSTSLDQAAPQLSAVLPAPTATSTKKRADGIARAR